MTHIYSIATFSLSLDMRTCSQCTAWSQWSCLAEHETPPSVPWFNFLLIFAFLLFPGLGVYPFHFLVPWFQFLLIFAFLPSLAWVFALFSVPWFECLPFCFYFFSVALFEYLTLFLHFLPPPVLQKSWSEPRQDITVLFLEKQKTLLDRSRSQDGCLVKNTI